MSRKLVVDGIDDDITVQDLREAFEPFGPVDEVKVVMDRETGLSMGYGFVVFRDDKDARVAMEQLDGSPLNHVTISVEPV